MCRRRLAELLRQPLDPEAIPLHSQGHHQLPRLDPEMIRAFVAPASGPKWLVLAGIDRVLMDRGIMPATSRPVQIRQVLAGASAGGWRMMAMASRDPLHAHAQLEDAYIHQSFRRGVSRSEVTAAYHSMLSEVFCQDRIAAAVEHQGADLAIHLTRARGPLGRPWLQGLAMAMAAVLNQVSPRTQKLLFERVLLHSRPEGIEVEFDGRVARLTCDNFLQAALATGSVPVYFNPVISIPGAPAGRYLDGGLTDYHLRQGFLEGEEGITLFPHFQKRIVPNWFDRWSARRQPGAGALSTVLQIYPAQTFLDRLPDRRIPTRQDFIDYAAEPERRIKRWLKVTRESDRLGEQFLDDLAKGKIPDLIEPF